MKKEMVYTGLFRLNTALAVPYNAWTSCASGKTGNLSAPTPLNTAQG